MEVNIRNECKGISQADCETDPARRGDSSLRSE